MPPPPIPLLSFNASLHLLHQWFEDYQQLEILTETLKPLTGGSPENKYHFTVWRAFDHYTAAVSMIIGDNAEWLSWYLFDTPKAGKNVTFAKAASWEKPRPLRTLRQLLTLIRAK